MSSRIDLIKGKKSDERPPRKYDVEPSSTVMNDPCGDDFLNCWCWSLLVIILIIIVWVILNSIRNYD